jgi:hypothetical protein
MNNQLRQFERESGLEIFGLGARRDKWERAMSKYAELIVNQCAELANEETSLPYDSYSEKIREHFFGVEP